MRIPIIAICGLLPAVFTGCATSQLEKQLAGSDAQIADIGAESVVVSLPEPSEKYERFRGTLEQSMKDRYVKTGGVVNVAAVDFAIAEVHFDHKGASFGSGGLSGGNWVRGTLRLRCSDSTTEVPVEKKFNTGGGYTVFQDWEDRMIKELLVLFDKALVEAKKEGEQGAADNPGYAQGV